jgi:hypothetical protein
LPSSSTADTQGTYGSPSRTGRELRGVGVVASSTDRHVGTKLQIEIAAAGGLLAIRDVVSHLRADGIDYAFGYGASQSGRAAPAAVGRAHRRRIDISGVHPEPSVALTA